MMTTSRRGYPEVLLFGSSNDPHIDRLADAIRARSWTPLRFDVDNIPSSEWCSFTLSRTEPRVEFPHPIDNIHSVFYRRLAMVRSHRMWRHIPEAKREFAVWEAETALVGLCSLLRHLPWVNPHTTIDTANNKPLQLLYAREVGLEIPETLISNSPDEVRAFFDKHDGLIIYKPLSISVVISTDSETGMVYTSRVPPEALSEDERIRAVPGIFQKEVKRGKELRVVVVDQDIFPVEVVPADPEEVDWRRGLDNGTTFKRTKLDNSLEKKLLSFMERANLRYGAFDLIVNEDGIPVFLEVNPQGAYLWLEDELQLPITDALATALCHAPVRHTP